MPDYSLARTELAFKRDDLKRIADYGAVEAADAVDAVERAHAAVVEALEQVDAAAEAVDGD